MQLFLYVIIQRHILLHQSSGDTVVDCGNPGFIEFGSVDVPTTVEGSLARYTCRAGYRLRGVSVRTCLSSGVWSDVSPVCDGEYDVIMRGPHVSPIIITNFLCHLPLL